VSAVLAGAAFAQQRPLIIDVHQHYSNRPGYFEDLDKTYRAHGARACVNGFASDMKAIAEAAKKYPQTVIPFGRIRLDDPNAIAELKAFRQAGFKGIKVHSPGKDYDDASYFPIYEAAEQQGVLLLMHTGISSRRDPGSPTRASFARMRPAFLSTIARAFPKLNIVGAHLGNPWYEEAVEAARWDPNLFFDVTGSTLYKYEGNLRIFLDYFWWRPGMAGRHTPDQKAHAFEKLVFGTDEDPRDLEGNIGRYRRMLAACGVPEPSQNKILGGTVAGLLGMQ
jgi:predicted TIM-barrel fold metal-dependent hydrolase